MLFSIVGGFLNGYFCSRLGRERGWSTKRVFVTMLLVAPIISTISVVFKLP